MNTADRRRFAFDLGSDTKKAHDEIESMSDALFGADSLEIHNSRFVSTTRMMRELKLVSGGGDEDVSAYLRGYRFGHLFDAEIAAAGDDA